jgi:predicted nucleic acid-binding protein
MITDPQGPGTEDRPGSPWTVVDAAVLAVALTDDGPDGDRVRQRLAGCRLAAPATVDLELLNVWQRGATTGALPYRRIDLAMADLARLPLTRVAPIDLLAACWERLPAAGTVDAAYLVLADALDAPLLTADPRLAAASRGRVELLR